MKLCSTCDGAASCTEAQRATREKLQRLAYDCYHTQPLPERQLVRGLRTDTNEWLVGYYIYTDDVHRIVSATTGKAHRVNPGTVGRYVGRRDILGKRIFEGDIVHSRVYCCTVPVAKNTFVVRWHDDIQGTIINSEDTEDLTVIGDIYTTKEALQHDA